MRDSDNKLHHHSLTEIPRVSSYYIESFKGNRCIEAETQVFKNRQFIANAMANKEKHFFSSVALMTEEVANTAFTVTGDYSKWESV